MFQPDNGSVAITNDGADLTYAPDDNYCNDGDPTDDFTYTISDGNGEEDTANVAVTVTCVNDRPIIDLNGDGDGNEGINNAASFTEDWRSRDPGARTPGPRCGQRQSHIGPDQAHHHP